MSNVKFITDIYQVGGSIHSLSGSEWNWYTHVLFLFYHSKKEE